LNVSFIPEVEIYTNLAKVLEDDKKEKGRRRMACLTTYKAPVFLKGRLVKSH